MLFRDESALANSPTPPQLLALMSLSPPPLSGTEWGGNWMRNLVDQEKDREISSWLPSQATQTENWGGGGGKNSLLSTEIGLGSEDQNSKQ